MAMAVVEVTKEWCSSLTIGRAGQLSLGIVFGGLNKKYSDDDDDDDDDDLVYDYFQVSSMKPAEAVAAWKGMVEKA